MSKVLATIAFVLAMMLSPIATKVSSFVLTTSAEAQDCKIKFSKKGILKKC